MREVDRLLTGFTADRREEVRGLPVSLGRRCSSTPRTTTCCQGPAGQRADGFENLGAVDLVRVVAAATGLLTGDLELPTHNGVTYEWGPGFPRCVWWSGPRSGELEGLPHYQHQPPVRQAVSFGPRPAHDRTMRCPPARHDHETDRMTRADRTTAARTLRRLRGCRPGTLTAPGPAGARLVRRVEGATTKLWNAWMSARPRLVGSRRSRHRRPVPSLVLTTPHGQLCADVTVRHPLGLVGVQQGLKQKPRARPGQGLSMTLKGAASRHDSPSDERGPGHLVPRHSDSGAAGCT